MEEARRSVVARGVLRGEVAPGVVEAAHAVRFGEGWQASFWGRAWFLWAIVGAAVYAAAGTIVTLVIDGFDGGELLAGGATALVLGLFAIHVHRRQRRVARSLALNRLLLASVEG